MSGARAQAHQQDLICRDIYVFTHRTRSADGGYNHDPHHSGRVHYSQKKVSLPRSLGRGGKLKKPPRFHDADPNTHVVIREGTIEMRDDKARFFAALSKAIRKSKSSNVLMITPGYSTPMDKYVRIAAKLAKDLSFLGVVILNSWPSGTKLDYFSVESWSQVAESLSQFLLDFKEMAMSLPNDVRLYMINHSMGCRVATTGLGRYIGYLGNNARNIQRGLELIPQVVFAASDQSISSFKGLVDRFLQARQTARNKRPNVVAPILTVYCSREDIPLAVSGWFHLQDLPYSRLGRTSACINSISDGELNLVQADFVDVVDVTGISTHGISKHSYYYAEASFQDDIMALFRGERARVRAQVRPALLRPHGTIYAFHPDQVEASRYEFVTRSIFGTSG